MHFLVRVACHKCKKMQILCPLALFILKVVQKRALSLLISWNSISLPEKQLTLLHTTVIYSFSGLLCYQLLSGMLQIKCKKYLSLTWSFLNLGFFPLNFRTTWNRAKLRSYLESVASNYLRKMPKPRKFAKTKYAKNIQSRFLGYPQQQLKTRSGCMIDNITRFRNFVRISSTNFKFSVLLLLRTFYCHLYILSRNIQIFTRRTWLTGVDYHGNMLFSEGDYVLEA